MSKADELKSKNENLFERNTILLNENERLKKENEELGAKYLRATDEGTSFAHLKSLERKNAELNNQLTKAKEILKMIVDYYPCYNKTITEQARQFLKEIEK